MSSGVVVCEGCRREVHQWGPSESGFAGRGPKTWIHCDDRSAICKGCRPVYPASLTTAHIRGPWCGCDRDGDIPEIVTRPAPAKQAPPKVRFSKGSFKPIATKAR